MEIFRNRMNAKVLVKRGGFPMTWKKKIFKVSPTFIIQVIIPKDTHRTLTDGKYLSTEKSLQKFLQKTVPIQWGTALEEIPEKIIRDALTRAKGSYNLCIPYRHGQIILSCESE